MDDVIRLEKVCKRLGSREILKDVSFTVKQGDIFGYLGPNGAGKTTTIRILLGLFKANSGKASILGRDASIDETRKMVGFVLESDGLYDNMSAYANLEYFASIYGVSDAAERIGRVLKLVGLFDRAEDKVGTYSKGMRQRLALARAVVHDPAVLILDEPTAGVDPSGQIEVRQVILDMTRQEGKTVVFSSHNLDEVQRICNRIALINKGEIKLYGELSELQQQMGHGEVVIETANEISGTVLAELKDLTKVTVRDKVNQTLVLALDGGTDTADIVNFLTQRGVRIEQVKRRDASVEEMYTAILKEAELRS